VTIPRLDVDEDVARGSTLPREAYFDRAWQDALADRVLARAWHLVSHDATAVTRPGRLTPVDLLPGCLDEPLLLSCDARGALHGLSNVCTHRGAVLVPAAAGAASITCGYHGRRFGLDGRFLSMPRCEGAKDFPSPADDLPRVALGRAGHFLFASLDPAVPFERWIAPLASVLPDESAAWAHDPASDRTYDVAAPWIAYVENYLEGFHVPFVHPGLAEALDPGAYDVVPLDVGVRQVGYAADRAAPALDVAPGPRGADRAVAAAWLWLFPTTMFNVYPWGLSVNVVEPVAEGRTRVRFLSFVRDPSLRAAGAGGDLDGVEREDEAVVERVARGVRSRLYRRGRYAPSEEAGVHRFHRLLAAALNGDAFPPR
jgi:choline monooxygenase